MVEPSAKAVELARRCQRETDASRETLEIRKVLTGGAKVAQEDGAFHQLRYRPLSFADLFEVVAGPHQPVAKHARAHACPAVVENVDQRSSARTVRGAFDLEVAEARAIDDQCLATVAADKDICT